MWVEGEEFHFIASDGDEWYYTGTEISTPVNAKPGSCWIEGAEFSYISETGKKRRFAGVFINITVGKEGSTWVETDFLHWLSEIKDKIRGHQDTAHGDSAAHSDVAHSDIA